ncbi:MAG: glycoside-pentoside-hexuronide (GPH):cation symporter, partial [Clostridia bacterium]|nr:glycoside-pentoside-hexuronide (GPH):cation symporter [Clostridia bacterium]
YGSFFFGQNIIYVLQFQFLTYYYTESVGLSIASTTLLLLVARVLDAVYDPVMGAIVDKHPFKSDKYLPWIRIATYFVPLSLVFVFVNVGQTYNQKLIYAYVTYILWGMLYTISDSPLFSLSTAMTNHVYERDKLIAFGRFAAALAAISSSVFMSLKGGIGWTGSIGIYALLAFICMMPLQFAARERVRYKRSKDITFAKIYRFLFKNKKLLIYYIGFLAISSTNTLQTMAAYFANSNLGNENIVTVIMAVSILPVLIIAPMLPMLIKKFGKKNLTVFSCVMAIMLCIVQYFAGYGVFAVFLTIAAVRVVFMQIPLLIYGMFTADCIEYGAYINGERTEAVSFSVQTFVTKLASALCGTICLQLLGAFGYVEKVKEQTPFALSGIWILMSLVPVAGYAVMLIIMLFFYNLSEQQVAQMSAVNRLRDIDSTARQ